MNALAWALGVVVALVIPAADAQEVLNLPVGDRSLSADFEEVLRVGAGPEEWEALVDVTSVAFDANGNLFIADLTLSGLRILVVSPSGEPLATIGRRGSGPGEFRGATIHDSNRMDSYLATDSSGARPGGGPAGFLICESTDERNESMRKLVLLLAVALATSACMDLPTSMSPIDEVATSVPAASAFMTDCDLIVCPENPPRVGGGGSGAVANDVGITVEECQNPAMTDSDGDGLSDYCEEVVAEAFAPWMKTQTDDEGTDRDEYYVVMPGTGNRILVFYAFGYYRDHGRGQDWYAHNGDSEFAVIEIAAQSSETWYMTDIFLSAHFRRR